MSRFLFCPWPAAGDAMPLMAAALALRDRGHEVLFFGNATVSGHAAAAGLPCRVAADRAYKEGYDGPEGGDLMRAVPILVDELRAVAAEFQPSVIVDGVMPVGARLVAEMRGIPWATICATGCHFPSINLFPYGMGVRPASTMLEQVMLRATWERQREGLAPEIERWDALRASYGLAPSGDHPVFGAPSPWLTIVPTVPEFEYPRPDLPASVHFVGPVFWNAPAAGEIPALPDDGRPLVYLSQGNTFNRNFAVMRGVLEALADEPVTILAATGRDPNPGELGTVPANAIVRRGFPLRDLFPRISLAITHAGFSSVHLALMHGVPMVLFPFAADQPENAQRVVQAGAGLRLPSHGCSVAAIRDAARRVLGEPGFGANARRLRDLLASHDGPREAADLLERLATA